ncbi:hypothetical protein ACFVW1_14575 [Streptomyces olivochromogenes]|uniref:hypothetical protein n=1 Tax=Streptomyces olivochromogenes TaxID=1963 RepID=UPI0036DF8E21
MTQAWLAAGDDTAALVTGRYFHHQQPHRSHPATRSAEVQDRLLEYCADLTNVELSTAVSAD